MKLQTCGIAAIVALSAPAMAFAGGIVMIDDFDDAVPFVDSIDSGFGSASMNGSMIGGTRELEYAVLESAFGLSLDVAILPETGVFFAAAPGVFGELSLGYDANGDGLDADFGDADTIVIDFEFVDLPFNLDFEVTTNGEGASAIETIVVPASATGFSLEIPLAAFTGDAMFNDIDEILVTFNSTDTVNGLDFGISRIYAVPTPGAASLLGLAGLVAVRRRR